MYNHTSRWGAAIAAVLTLCMTVPAAAQQFVRSVQITSAAAEPLTDVQVVLNITANSFDYGQASADGSDLRFASTNPVACPPSFDIPHWVEFWRPGGFSQIWLKIPSVPAGGTVTVFFYHGSEAGDDTSDFAAVFPDALISQGNTVLDGDIDVDWFEVSRGDVISVRSVQPLRVNARRIRIGGTINATGAGFIGSSAGSSSPGQGPGGGSRGLIINGDGSGGGGGGYGGGGGAGGGGFGDQPGAGGMVYGDTLPDTIQMGSGGAGSRNTRGGNGGGLIALRAQYVTVADIGQLLADGAPGGNQGVGDSDGGGGGSGGGILVYGYSVRVSGALSAAGGAGSSGPNIATSADGGGGGAGRIKLSSEQPLNETGARYNLAGGAAGRIGNPQPGRSNRVLRQTIEFAEVTAALGVAEFCTPAPEIDVQGNNQSISNGDDTPAADDLTDFGTLLVGQSDSRSFSVLNDGGNTALRLTGDVPVTVIGSPAFSVEQQPPDSIDDAAAANFTLRFQPHEAGEQLATVSIENNDPDESPYTFTVRGIGAIESPAFADEFEVLAP